MMNTADDVLREPYITYDLPLAKAREWIKKRDKPLLAEAIKLLKEFAAATHTPCRSCPIWPSPSWRMAIARSLNASWRSVRPTRWR